MKILFAGTPDFAVAPLKNIIQNGFEVVGVITQIDKPQGRKGTLNSTPSNPHPQLCTMNVTLAIHSPKFPTH